MKVTLSNQERFILISGLKVLREKQAIAYRDCPEEEPLHKLGLAGDLALIKILLEKLNGK